MQHTRQVLLGRYRRYGPAELEHLLLARKKGVPVPQVYGYAEKRLAGLMVTNTAVMMEDFSGAETLGGVLASQPTLKEEEAALAVAGSLLLRLHAAGCNHIDLNAGNIFLPTESLPEGGVIDLMYACFHPIPSLNTLCFMVGYLANSMAFHIPADRIDHWIAEVIAASEGANRQAHWLDVVSAFRGRRLSRHERLALD
ncbi:MAG: hypothetical protein HN380_10885 [Victivallales bacterium]|nr:hypothetical protein [Victivallales bacterium]